MGSNCRFKRIYTSCEDCPEADKDYCEGVKQLKKDARDGRVKCAIEYLNKHGIEFTPTKTKHVVWVDYYFQKCRFSLNHFKLFINNKWVLKRKSKLLKPDTVLKFGKHKGKTIKEADDINYTSWLLSETDFMMTTDIFKQVS